MKKKIPEFTTDNDAERFVDTADLAQYDLSGFKPAHFEFEAKAAQLNMRLPQTLLDAVKESAKARGIPYTRLVREILEEAVAGRVRSNCFALEALSIGNLQLLVESRSVLVDGRSVHLTTKERALLELLLLRKGMVITKEVLMNHLYGDVDQPEVKIVDVLVSRLCKKLLDAGSNNAIGTVWGQGYVLQDDMSDQSNQEAHPLDRNINRRRKFRDAS